MTKIRITLQACFLSLVVMALPALAATSSTTAPAKGAVQAQQPLLDATCGADEQKFCTGLDAKARSACLQDHFADVSETCHAVLQKSRDNFAVCKTEIATYCANAGYGGGRMIGCLREHEKKLSAPCATRVGPHIGAPKP